MVTNYYGAITDPENSGGLYTALKVMADELRAGLADEHGGWEIGIASDGRRGNYAAINEDWRIIGTDIHTGEPIGVLEVRQSSRDKYGTHVTKNCYLVGRNEDNTAFGHAVPTATIGRAQKIYPGDMQSQLIAVQTYIFGADYRQVVRQGDIGFIACRKPAGLEVIGKQITIMESHVIRGRAVVQRGESIYVQCPHVTHPTHDYVAIKAGWYKIIIGRRAQFRTIIADIPQVD
jgi:hypothetical protein